MDSYIVFNQLSSLLNEMDYLHYVFMSKLFLKGLECVRSLSMHDLILNSKQNGHVIWKHILNGLVQQLLQKTKNLKRLELNGDIQDKGCLNRDDIYLSNLLRQTREPLQQININNYEISNINVLEQVPRSCKSVSFGLCLFMTDFLGSSIHTLEWIRAIRFVGCKFVSFFGFLTFPKTLCELVLQNCSLRSVDLTHIRLPPHLKRLDLSYNKLKDKDLEHSFVFVMNQKLPDSLMHLSVQHNSLTLQKGEARWRLPLALKTCDLSANNLLSGFWEQLQIPPNLVRIDARQNNLSPVLCNNDKILF